MVHFDDVLRSFTDLSNSAVLNLSGMIELIEEGMAPSPERNDELIVLLGELRKSYENVKEYVNQQLGEQAAIVEDAPVSRYKEQLDELRTRMFKEHVERAKELLQAFMSVRSYDDFFQDALTPAQEVAKDTLNVLIGEIDVFEDSCDSIGVDMSNPQDFMAALEMDGFGSKEGAALLDRIRENMSMNVVIGLTTGKYFKTTIDKEPRLEYVAVRETESNAVAAETDGEASNDDLSTEAVDGTSLVKVTMENPSDDTDSKDSNDDAPIPPERAVKATAKLGVKQIENKLLTRMPYGTPIVISTLMRFGVCTDEQLIAFSRYIAGDHGALAADDVKKSIASMERANIACTFVVDGEPAYCMTRAGQRVLMKETIRNHRTRFVRQPYWPIPFEEHDCRAGLTMRPSTIRQIISENDSLLSQYSRIREEKGNATAFSAIKNTHRINGVYSLDFLEDDEVVEVCPERLSDDDGNPATIGIDGGNTTDKVAIPDHVGVSDGEVVPGGTTPENCGLKQNEHELDTCGNDSNSGDNKNEDKRVQGNATEREEVDPLDVTSDAFSPGSRGGSELRRAALLDESQLSDTANPADVVAAEFAIVGMENGVSRFETVENPDTKDLEPSRLYCQSDEIIIRDELHETSTVTLSQSVADRARSLVKGSEHKSDSVMYRLVLDMIDEAVDRESGSLDMDRFATALTFVSALSDIDDYNDCRSLDRRLHLAVDPFSEDVAYTSGDLSSAFSASEPVEEASLLAAYLNAMVFPTWGGHDHDLWSQCEQQLNNYDSVFPQYRELKRLYGTLFVLHEVSSEGFSQKIMKQITKGKDHEKQLADLRDRAIEVDRRAFSISHPYGVRFCQECIGPESDIGRAMQMITGADSVDSAFLQSLCNRFCDPVDGGHAVSSAKIADFVEAAWHDILAELDSGRKGGRIEKLKSYQRNPALAACKKRVGLIAEWVIMNDEGAGIDSATVSRMREIRDQTLQCTSELLTSASLVGKPGCPILLCALGGINKYLRGDTSAWVDYRSFLESGFVTLDDDLIPIINPNLNSVTYAEPWRNVLRHYIAEPLSLADAELCIGDRNSVMYDNLTQLAHIHSLMGKVEKAKTTEKRKAQAKRGADSRLDEFQNDLEMNVLYNLIDDDQKETIDGCWRAYQEYFYELGDFGLWLQFLNALREQVKDIAREQHDTLARKINDRYQGLDEGEDASILDAARRLLDEDSNFATVEEYINLFDEGERAYLEKAGGSGEKPTISAFLDDEVHDALYEQLTRKMLYLESFSEAAKAMLKETLPEEWDNEQKRRSITLFSYWPEGDLTDYDVKRIGNFLRGVGFDVNSPTRIKSTVKSTQYEVKMRKVDRGRTDYPHPISNFGTEAPSVLQVLVLPERSDVRTVFEEVERLQNPNVTIVVIDKALKLSERRRIAETCHKEKSGLSRFICIDRLLAVYLASFEVGDRLPELLRCSLPFTNIQPFAGGSGSIPDEMFFGRRSELRKIMDPKGPALVYGGRQLGKSALLERAEHYFTNGDDKRVSALCKIETLSTDEAVIALVVETFRAKGLRLPRKIDGMEGLCASLGKALADGRAERILLLIDEADLYLKAIRPKNYANIIPLVNLMRETRGRFKFVLAGLHNVAQARKAFENNGTLGQLGEPLCIRPLTRQDALELIERPLSYLGYHIDEYPYLMTILTKTNYYPGILQFFGYTLVESISEHYGLYYRAIDGNPPYALNPRQLGEILKKKELRDSVNKRFKQSLEISVRYEIIAHVVALLYRECEENDENIRERDGFEPTEIWNWIEEFRFPPFANDDPTSFIGLLDEMCEMNILFRGGDSVPLYRLRHYDFLRIIGGSTVDEILEELEAFV